MDSNSGLPERNWSKHLRQELGGGDWKVSELVSVRIGKCQNGYTPNNSDTFQFWHFPILTLSNSDTFQFWQFPILTHSNSDTFRFWHFPILALSDSDTFQFWRKMHSDTFQFWHFPVSLRRGKVESRDFPREFLTATAGKQRERASNTNQENNTNWIEWEVNLSFPPGFLFTSSFFLVYRGAGTRFGILFSEWFTSFTHASLPIKRRQTVNFTVLEPQKRRKIFMLF